MAASNSLSIRSFVRIALDESVPDHSTISRTRRLMDVETHQAVFQWVLQVLAERSCCRELRLAWTRPRPGSQRGAFRSIVRRDTGERYEDSSPGWRKESGIETPTRQAKIAKLDRRRTKKGNNDDWKHPHDPDARITKMKDGRTHLAHKAEHAVDMETGAIVAVTLHGADEGDTKTIPGDGSGSWRAHHLHCGGHRPRRRCEAGQRGRRPREVVTDKGYHSRAVVGELTEWGVHATYCSEPNRGRQKWQDLRTEQAAVYTPIDCTAFVESEVSVCCGNAARSWNDGINTCMIRAGCAEFIYAGRKNILKRLVVHSGAANLGLLMRKLFGKGTARPAGRLSLQAVSVAERFCTF